MYLHSLVQLFFCLSLNLQTIIIFLTVLVHSGIAQLKIIPQRLGTLNISKKKTRELQKLPNKLRVAPSPSSG